MIPSAAAFSRGGRGKLSRDTNKTSLVGRRLYLCLLVPLSLTQNPLYGSPVGPKKENKQTPCPAVDRPLPLRSFKYRLNHQQLRMKSSLETVIFLVLFFQMIFSLLTGSEELILKSRTTHGHVRTITFCEDLTMET